MAIAPPDGRGFDALAFVAATLPILEGSIGRAHQLSFAGAGRSGASFGLHQHDVAAGGKAPGSPRLVLAALLAGYAADPATPEDRRPTPAQIDMILAAAAVPALTLARFRAKTRGVPGALACVQAALSSRAGRAAVQALDRQVAGRVAGHLRAVIDAARANPNGPGAFGPGHGDAARSLAATAHWINQTGGRARNIEALARGRAVRVNGRHVAAAAAAPAWDDLVRYLSATKYYAEHPAQLRSMLARAAQAAASLVAAPRR